MQTVYDLATKSNFYDDPANGFGTKQTGLLTTAAGLTYSTTVSHQQRFAVQTMMFKCFADKNLDAIVYPSNTLPPRIMGSTAGPEPSANDWSGSSTFPSNMGFPAITVPAGFTTQVFDRVRDANAPGGTRLVGPGAGKASRGDRFSCHAVWRTDALPDRLGVRKSDPSSDVAPRIWPVGREEMRG
jgi:Asp-tRNA(Asn)/Glu-tRNA(Gln) amidotransferase A subunit family amidase